jgi:beta-glucosidase
MGLPGVQLDWLKAVEAACAKAGKPLALVVVQGKAFGEPWIKAVMPAVLEAWQSGQAQGTAVAETLFGLNNPAGRTAVSFPVSADVLPVYYNYKPTSTRGGYTNPPVIPGGVYPPSKHGTESVLYAFGHGLSYGASFKYSGLKVSPASPSSLPARGDDGAAIGVDGSVSVSFSVTNNGTASAEEVVQLYVRDEISSVTTAIMQLRGFQRLPPIAPGATVPVTLELVASRDLWLIDLEMRKVVEPGQFTVMVGGASDAIQQTATFTVA